MKVRSDVAVVWPSVLFLSAKWQWLVRRSCLVAVYSWQAPTARIISLHPNDDGQYDDTAAVQAAALWFSFTWVSNAVLWILLAQTAGWRRRRLRANAVSLSARRLYSLPLLLLLFETLPGRCQ